MKNIFTTTYNANKLDLVLLMARVTIVALMLSHGLPKLQVLFSNDAIQFPGMFGMGPGFTLALTVFAEVLCSLLILIGLGTRLATIPLIITMLVAVVLVHGNDPFAKQEPAIQYLLVYGIILITGAGKYSVDYLVNKNSLRLNYPKIETVDPTIGIYN